MDGSGTADRVDRAALSRQWRQEGRYEEIAEFRQQVKEATKKAWRSAGRHWDRDELNEVAWQEAARAFPPLDTEGMPGTDSQSESAHRGRVQGLGDIPASWGTLPANASLQSELNWVQANRLLIVEERPVVPLESTSIEHSPRRPARRRWGGWKRRFAPMPSTWTS